MSSVSYSPVLDEPRSTLRDIVSCSGAIARAAFWLYTCAAESRGGGAAISAALGGSRRLSAALALS